MRNSPHCLNLSGDLSLEETCTGYRLKGIQEPKRPRTDFDLESRNIIYPRKIPNDQANLLGNMVISEKYSYPDLGISILS